MNGQDQSGNNGYSKYSLSWAEIRL